MKGESADELDRICNAVTTAVINAQESVGRPIDSHRMDLFNHLVVELFDPRTCLEWESATSDSTVARNININIHREARADVERCKSKDRREVSLRVDQIGEDSFRETQRERGVCPL